MSSRRDMETHIDISTNPESRMRGFSFPTSGRHTGAAGIASGQFAISLAPSLTSTDRKNKLMKKIGIIGGGLGGLSAACVLAARGHSVILFERNHWLGGKAAQLRGNGFRFDMGPTIVT